MTDRLHLPNHRRHITQIVCVMARLRSLALQYGALRSNSLAISSLGPDSPPVGRCRSTIGSNTIRTHRIDSADRRWADAAGETTWPP